jgi:YVTN family beta-propeller protein
VLGLLSLSLFAIPGIDVPAGQTSPPHRSPVDLAVLPSGERALTANHTSDSVSLVDLKQGKVVAEVTVGHKPAGIACSKDGKRAAVSNLWSGTVTLFDVRNGAIRIAGEVRVGPLPRGLAFAPDGQSLFVAVSGRDEIAVVGWDERQVRRRWSAPREPRELAISPDCKLIAAISSRSADVRCWSLADGQLVFDQKLHLGFNLRGVTFSADSKVLHCSYVYNRERPVTENNITEGWLLDNRLVHLPLKKDPQFTAWELSLDLRGQAAGDPHGVAASADGRWLAVAASGTGDLLFFEREHIPWSPGHPGDFMDVGLEVGNHKHRRVDLGGRPMTVAFADNRTIVAVNYLRDAVQVVDTESAKLVRTIHLGGPDQPSLARQGETIFYDARRSHHHWFSCHTCHVDGHTNGLNWDTLNDQSYGNPKLTPSLFNVSHTSPYTWHGWQKELADSIDKSLKDTMFGRSKPGDVHALLAYFKTLTPPPNPHRADRGLLTPEAQRGKAIFESKARCVRCHKGEYYTSESNYDLKLGYDGSPFDHYNPPSLIGLWNRGPYLHDGRAETLDELLQRHHVPEKLGGDKLSEQERRELIEFLKAL